MLMIIPNKVTINIMLDSVQSQHANHKQQRVPIGMLQWYSKSSCLIPTVTTNIKKTR
jgi:hypothetical protein